MIGMMNNQPVDSPVEFYAGRRCLPTLREDKQYHIEIQLLPVQKKLSYTETGRRLVDGSPEESDDTPAEMWGQLMLKVSCQKAIEEGLARAGRKQRGSKLIRRLLSRGTSLRTLLSRQSAGNKEKDQQQTQQQQQRDGKQRG